MEIYYSPTFKRKYKKMPHKVKTAVKEKEVMLRANPFDPRLKTHKLTGDLSGLWAYSVTYSYRIVFEFLKNKDMFLHDIGTHDVYK